jgi:predicted dithiol-disulfide oxidoreductase (DUF899 family)
MQPHKIVSESEWIAARKAHLAVEKKFTEARDELSRQRRELPWVKVDKPYVFEGPQGRETLAELFGGRSQLIVYHFMFGPGWEQGCPSCSFLSDHFDGTIVHLAQRDVTMLAVSRAPLPQIEAFKKRMGWRFKWVSSFGSDFNRDYHVSFTKDELEQSKAYYNYQLGQFPAEEAPGVSVFYKDAAGAIFHTYSAYARGLDILVGTCSILCRRAAMRPRCRGRWLGSATTTATRASRKTPNLAALDTDCHRPVISAGQTCHLPS